MDIHVLNTLLSAWSFCPAFGSFVYHLLDEDTYSMAEKKCADRGMSVVMATNPSDMDALICFVEELTISGDMWLGLTHGGSMDPRDFTWADGSRMTWAQWGELGPSSPKEPNHLDTDHCVQIQRGNLKWYTRRCQARYYIICQEPSGDGVYFDKLVNTRPRGPPLVELRTESPVTCANLCRQRCACDVIEIDRNGLCRLHHSSDMTENIHDDYEWRIYQKR